MSEKKESEWGCCFVAKALAAFLGGIVFWYLFIL